MKAQINNVTSKGAENSSMLGCTEKESFSHLKNYLPYGLLSSKGQRQVDSL